jgi:hypothetical protein
MHKNITSATMPTKLAEILSNMGLSAVTGWSSTIKALGQDTMISSPLSQLQL